MTDLYPRTVTSQFPRPSMSEIGRPWPTTIQWVIDRRRRGLWHRLLIRLAR
jgi:hypothetical protein